MLEFVVVFPVVLTLILGVVQFAQIWVAKIVVHYAAFCAGRAALVAVMNPGGPTTDNDSWPSSMKLYYEGLTSAQRKGESKVPNDVPNGYARTEAERAANKAAAQVCAWIVMGERKDRLVMGGGGNVWRSDRDNQRKIPGWSYTEPGETYEKIPGSGSAERKTRAFIDTSPNNTTNVAVTVEHDLALIVPIVGPMIGWAMNPWHPDRPWAKQEADTTGDAYSDTGVEKVVYPHLRLRETVWIPKPYQTVIAAGG